MSFQPRSLFHSLVVNTLASLVFLVTVTAVALVAPASAEEADVETVSWFGGHGGWWGEPMSAAHHCESGVDRFVGRLTEHAEEEVEFTATQQAAWDDLIAAIRTGGEGVTRFCARVDEARQTERAPAPERLAMAEEAVSVGLKTLQTIRPAFDAFYATLDPEQKELLDNAGRHHRGGGWWH